MPAFPRAHSIPLDFGFSGLGFSFFRTPFSTMAIMEHLFTHMSQVVGISKRGTASLATFCWRSGMRQACAWSRVAPTAPPVAIFRNPRRFMMPLALDSGCAASLPAGFRLRRIHRVVVKKCESIVQLLGCHVLCQWLCSLHVLPFREVGLPLSLRLDQRRDLSALLTLDVARLAGLLEVELSLRFISLLSRAARAQRYKGQQSDKHQQGNCKCSDVLSKLF